jgi:hypothetical protein
MQVVQRAYVQFRQKWDPTMPDEFPGNERLDCARLTKLPSPSCGEFQSRLPLDSAVVEQL